MVAETHSMRILSIWAVMFLAAGLPALAQSDQAAAETAIPDRSYGGWYTAETGRQPWVIWGVLRTADTVSPVPSGALLSTLIAFV
jgi:hypothetical protein